MRSPGADTVTFLRAAVVNDRGAAVPNWSATPTTIRDVDGCELQPGASVEDLANRGGQRAAWTIFAPLTDFTSTLTGDDRARFEGRDWPILGDPEVWRHPRLGHVKVLVASWRDLP